MFEIFDTSGAYDDAKYVVLNTVRDKAALATVSYSAYKAAAEAEAAAAGAKDPARLRS